MEVKELIVETALVGFVEKGFDNISLNELVKRTGLSKGAFYYYFKNKEKLLEEIYQRYLYRYINEYINKANVSEGNAFEKINQMIHFVLKMHTSVYSDYNTRLDPKLFFRLLNDGFTKDPRLNAMNIENNNKIIKYMCSVVQEGQKDKIIRQDIEAELIAKLISTTVKGAMFEWLSINIDLEILLRTNLSTIINMISA